MVLNSRLVETTVNLSADLILTEDQLKTYTLIEINELLRVNGLSLSDCNMSVPYDIVNDDRVNPFILDEFNYDRDAMRIMHSKLMSTITNEQRLIYDGILDVVLKGSCRMFFVCGFGGTGKTYLWSLLGSYIRSEGKIIINVASSGIASLLLQGGRTSHSRFAIPILVNEFTMCSFSAGSHLAELIKQTKLIIWDEAPMMSRHCFETLDRTMRDVLKCDQPFGGKVVVFGGDFRQILPVITGGNRVETVMATLNSSPLWDHCRVLKLTKNMRLHAAFNDYDSLQIESFSKWILDIGDGKIDKDEGDIEIPEDLLITECDDPIKAIVREVYGEFFSDQRDPKFFQKRAILSPRNQDVDDLNEYMLSQLPGVEACYLGSDSIDKSDTGKYDDITYSQEFLNSIKVSGLPKHELKLKIGTPIMLLRNIDPKGGLCNGTRLLVTQLASHVIEAVLITCERVGEKVLIPRMFVSPPEARFPFRMKRRQFPVAVAFAMTINKSQGQTLERVGVYLPKPVFTHGQLYVALSRVTSRKGLKILITDSAGKLANKTSNIVYTEVFQNV